MTMLCLGRLLPCGRKYNPDPEDSKRSTIFYGSGNRSVCTVVSSDDESADWRHPSAYSPTSVDVHACRSTVCLCCRQSDDSLPAFVGASKDIHPSQLRVMPKKWWEEEKHPHSLVQAIDDAINAIFAVFGRRSTDRDEPMLSLIKCRCG